MLYNKSIVRCKTDTICYYSDICCIAIYCLIKELRKEIQMITQLNLKNVNVNNLSNKII